MGRNKKKTTYTGRYYGITALLAVQLFVIAYPWDASALIVPKGGTGVFNEIPDTVLVNTPFTKPPSTKESVSDTKSVKPTEDSQEKTGQGEAVYSISSTGKGALPTGIFRDSDIKLAQTAEGGVGGTSQGVSASSDKSVLVRMEPLRLRRDRVRRRVVISPWLRTMMANFSWGGQVFDQYIRRFGPGIPASPSNSVGISIGASSGAYIWRPWLATLGIGMGTSYSTSTTDDSTRTGRGESGSISLGVFPMSRFPFNATYFKNRREIDAGISETITNSSGFTLRQRFRTKRKTSIHMGYSRITMSTDSTFTREKGEIVKDEQERMNINIARTLEKHTLNLRGTLEMDFDFNSKEESQVGKIVGTDKYVSRKGLRVNTIANYSGTETFVPRGTGDSTEVMSQSVQLSSSTGFRIYEGKVGVNVNGRVFRQSRGFKTITSGLTNQTQSSEGTMAAAIGLGYRINRNWSVSGSANTSRKFETDEPNPRYDQRVNTNYSADTLEIGKYTYNYGGSAAASNSITVDREILNFSTGMGHSLSRPLHAGRISNSSLTLGQSYNASQSFRPDTGVSESGQHNLGNSVSISNRISGRNKRLSMTLSVSDSRGGTLFEDFNSGNSQVINYKLNLSWTLSRTSSVTGSFSTQYSRTDIPPSGPSERMGNSGALSFREGLLFDVRALTFLSIMTIADEGAIPSFGDEDHRERFSWSNILEYKTGRFKLLASAAWDEINGDGAGVFRVAVTRTFGGRR